jgi:aspartyl-tRNA(Asn)/glutamyl-tRNA(Gln) amidotransferase subunit A
MLDLTELTADQAIRALRKGDISSRELTQAYIERIEQLEPTINAYITQTPDLALKQADESDQRLADWRKNPSNRLPLLTGLPLAVKDVLCVAGVRCTCGSRILENFTPPFNATVVEKLLAAGAVLLGKTNTDEFAMGSSTENSAYGVSHNPWDVSRVPGGSSGGSAAAVAARLAPIALGTDTGGSVRQPAAYCGVTGIKPTYGRVSRYGLVAFGSSLDTVGILGRDATDISMAFKVIAGHDHRDATTLEVPVPAIDLNSNHVLQGLRIGVPEEYFIAGIQAEVQEAVYTAISSLESLGAQVEKVSLPNTEFALPVYYLIAPAEASANLARYDGVRYGPRVSGADLHDMYFSTRGEKFGAEVKRRIMLGTYALSAGYYDAYYGQAQKVRTLIKRDFERVFESVDVIAAPVAPTTAFRIGEHSDDPLAMYLEDIFTIPANLAGIPGIAFPVGFDDSGLPIDMQLMGPQFREDLLLRIAHAYQQETDWHKKRPPI